MTTRQQTSTFLAVLSSAALALAARAAAWTNPVLPEPCPDPTFWQAPDSTWRCASTAQRILKSKDFLHWKDLGKRLFTDEE